MMKKSASTLVVILALLSNSGNKSSSVQAAKVDSKYHRVPSAEILSDVDGGEEEKDPADHTSDLVRVSPFEGGYSPANFEVIHQQFLAQQHAPVHPMAMTGHQQLLAQQMHGPANSQTHHHKKHQKHHQHHKKQHKHNKSNKQGHRNLEKQFNEDIDSQQLRTKFNLEQDGIISSEYSKHFENYGQQTPMTANSGINQQFSQIGHKAHQRRPHRHHHKSGKQHKQKQHHTKLYHEPSIRSWHIASIGENESVDQAQDRQEELDKAMRKLRHLNSFQKDQMEAATYGLELNKPVFDGDDQENREKIEQVMTASNDQNRRSQVSNFVQDRLSDMIEPYTGNTASLNDLKQWTNQIEQQGEQTVSKIESRTANVVEEAERIKSVHKRGSMEKEVNSARNKLMKGYKQDQKDKEVKAHIEEKEAKKESENKAKMNEQSLERIEKKQDKQKFKEQVQNELKNKENDPKLKFDEEDANKSDIEQQIDSAVSKAENDNKIPKEAEIEQAEKAVKVAATETLRTNQFNTVTAAVQGFRESVQDIINEV